MINSGRGWLDWVADRQGPEHSEWLRRLFDRVGNAVGNYVAGALGQAVVAGLLAYVVLLILGVPYAGSLAVVIFLLDLVPLVGATLGAVLVGIITVFNDFPTTTIVWTIWSIVYQQVENNIIQPRIQAQRRPGAPVRRPRLGPLRLDAVRRARRPAGDPGRRRDPDRDHRVRQLPPPGEHRRGAGAARRSAPPPAPTDDSASVRRRRDQQQRRAVQDQRDRGEAASPRS